MEIHVNAKIETAPKKNAASKIGATCGSIDLTSHRREAGDATPESIPPKCDEVRNPSQASLQTSAYAPHRKRLRTCVSPCRFGLSRLQAHDCCDRRPGLSPA